MIGLFLVLGALAGLFAGTMAYLITYEEYRKHFLHPGPAIRHSLETAAVAFLFFFVLTLVAGYVLVRGLT